MASIMPLGDAQEGEAPEDLSWARQRPESRPIVRLLAGDAPSEGSKRRRISPAVDEEEEEEEEEFSSPLRQPYIPDELYDKYLHPEIFEAFESVNSKYKAKLGRLKSLPTLEHFRRPSCLFDDPELLPVRESGTRAVLSAAKFVLGLSSSLGGKPLTRCSGFWINWDWEKKIGIVLTTAHLIRSMRPSANRWLGKDEYAPDAKVTVHLLDDTTAEGCLLYYQEHYELAFYSVRVDHPVQLPSFNDKVNCAQQVFRLGRDNNLNLKITHGRVEFLNANVYERHHFMYFLNEEDNYECDDDGGPIIDFNGEVVGMVNNSTRGSFIPYSVLDMCFDLWRRFGCIPRLHLGLKFSAIKLLDPVHAEKIWRKYNIDQGLIVEEVSKGSHAEQLGIRIGDIIECLGEEYISTTVELERKSLSKCKGYLSLSKCKGYFEGHFCAEVDISIQVFHTQKSLRRTRELTVMVSDRAEVVERDRYPITTGKVVSASVSPDQLGSRS